MTSDILKNQFISLCKAFPYNSGESFLNRDQMLNGEEKLLNGIHNPF